MIYLLLFVILFIVLIVLVGTSIVWLPTVILGFATYGFIWSKSVPHSNSPKDLSRFVKCDFDGSELHCEVDKKAVKSYLTSLKITIAMVCVLALIVTSAIVASNRDVIIELIELLDEDDFFKFFYQDMDITNFVSALITIALIYYLIEWTDGLESEISKGVSQTVEKSIFQPTDKLNNIIQDNVKLAQEELQIDFPPANTDAIQNYINTHKIKVLTNPSCLQTVIADEIEKIKQERDYLRKAINCLNEIMKLYKEVNRVVLEADSQSLITAIDETYESIYQAKVTAIPQREWALFEKAIEVYRQELKQLEEKARRYLEGDTTDYADSTNNPYTVLGVTPDMSKEEIKKVYRKLAQIYHPDKGIVSEDERFKKVSEAYKRIMNEKNKGGI